MYAHTNVEQHILINIPIISPNTDDANYMGYDEGFDGSSDNDSDITNNEIMNNECDDYEI